MTDAPTLREYIEAEIRHLRELRDGDQAQFRALIAEHRLWRTTVDAALAAQVGEKKGVSSIGAIIVATVATVVGVAGAVIAAIAVWNRENLP